MDYNYHGLVVVWDLDDTIFRERDFCRSGFRLIEKTLSEKYGEKFKGIAEKMNHYLTERKNYFDLLDAILADSGEEEFRDASARKTAVADIVNLYRNHLPSDLLPAEGIKETLDQLQNRGVVMALVTDGRSNTQRSKIKALKLDKYIPADNIYISEEQHADKTQPDSFQSIVRKYPEAKRFIYIGDNERKDFIMPNLLGWKTIKVLWNQDNVHSEYETTNILQAPSIRMSENERLIDILE